MAKKETPSTPWYVSLLSRLHRGKVTIGREELEKLQAQLSRIPSLENTVEELQERNNQLEEIASTRRTRHAKYKARIEELEKELASFTPIPEHTLYRSLEALLTHNNRHYVAFLLDENEQFLYATPHACALLNLRAEELYGLCAGEIFYQIVPTSADDKSHAARLHTLISPLGGSQAQTLYARRTLDPALQKIYGTNEPFRYTPITMRAESIDAGKAYVLAADPSILVKAVDQKKHTLIDVHSWRFDMLRPKDVNLDALEFLAAQTNTTSTELTKKLNNVYRTNIYVMQLHGNVGDYDINDRIISYVMNENPPLLIIDFTNATYVDSAIAMSAMRFAEKNKNEQGKEIGKTIYIIPRDCVCREHVLHYLENASATPQSAIWRQICVAESLDEALMSYGINPQHGTPPESKPKVWHLSDYFAYLKKIPDLFRKKKSQDE